MQTGDEILDALMADRLWRLDNLYQILYDAKIIPYVARPEQRAFRLRRHNCNIIPKARQLGMSTENVIENLDACIFNDNYRAAIIDRTEEDAWDKLEKAKLAWENGPLHPDSMIAQIWEKIHAEIPLEVSSNGEMRWANGSRFEAGVSFTGGTLQSLHVSELGPIAAQNPKKAAEIRRGSMNAVIPSGVKTIETTMEGGPHGVCYEYFQLGLKSGERNDLEISEWRMHFFSWLRHPDYVLKNRKPANGDIIKYFKDLSEKYGDAWEKEYGWREVPLERQAWYEFKKQELRDEIFQQFPTVLEECVRTAVAGQIYPEMAEARLKRLKEFNPDKGIPICTYWDLGSGVNIAGWVVQKSGKDINVLDWTWGEGKGASFLAEMIRHWGVMFAEYGGVACNFLPHDADTDDKGSGKTFRAQLIECGIPAKQVKVVPRIHSVWVGIEETRRRIPKMWFHTRTDVAVDMPDGQKLPGGFGRLESYRMTPKTSSGIVKGVPFPDFCSHSADALRYFCEADWRNMVDTLDYTVQSNERRLRISPNFEDPIQVKRGPTSTLYRGGMRISA